MKIYFTNEDALLTADTPANDVPVVKFSDHQSSLAEREQRIATLRGTVKSHIADLKGMENIFREHGSFKETADEILVAISELEAALAATEGAQYPRVEKETK